VIIHVIIHSTNECCPASDRFPNFESCHAQNWTTKTGCPWENIIKSMQRVSYLFTILPIFWVIVIDGHSFKYYSCTWVQQVVLRSDLTWMSPFVWGHPTQYAMVQDRKRH
jgi:hypothetical protein